MRRPAVDVMALASLLLAIDKPDPERIAKRVAEAVAERRRK